MWTKICSQPADFMDNCECKLGTIDNTEMSFFEMIL